MLSEVTGAMQRLGVLGAEGGSFLDALPDPMKLDWRQILFVMVVVSLLYVALRLLFFRPVMVTMDARDETIEGGQARHAEVAKLVTERQEAYEARLRELRAQAFERRKALTDAAVRERQAMVAEARAAADAERGTALARLETQAAQAREGLAGQVDQLAAAMVAHLLKT